MNKGEERSELRWVLAWAAVIVALSCVPYTFGTAITPPGYQFLGLTHNIDDGAVYLSWMRQAADGHFFIRNLFTNEPQAARQFNVLFLLMGWFAAITRLPLIWVYHIWRAALGIALILTVWRFALLFLNKPEQWKLLIPLVGLSAGVGWLFPGAKMPDGPVDVWQPEAITFLSIYLNPLFLAGLILMLWSLYFLTLLERTGRARFAGCAGLCLLLLGNVHTYDVVTVAAVWASYLIVRSILVRKIDLRLISLSALAALIASPAALYQFWLYHIDPVFKARANSPTPSPALWAFFAGYGLVLVGAIIGAVLWSRDRGEDSQRSALSPQLLIVWSVIGFALPYLPVGQQRKLIMGLHIPLCILCAYAIGRLTATKPRLSPILVNAVALAITMPSILLFMRQDMHLLSDHGGTAPGFVAYMHADEMAAMRYLRTHAAPSDTILAPPGFALFVPAIIGRQVWYGHWSETPNYGDRIRGWLSFWESLSDGVLDESLVSKSLAVYLVCYREDVDGVGGSVLAAAGGRVVYESGQVRVYGLLSVGKKVQNGY